jgi:hypothetical protein
VSKPQKKARKLTFPSLCIWRRGPDSNWRITVLQALGEQCTRVHHEHAACNVDDLAGPGTAETQHNGLAECTPQEAPQESPTASELEQLVAACSALLRLGSYRAARSVLDELERLATRQGVPSA